MKKCPSCGRMYGDAALNFCLQDGAVLEEETVSTFGSEGAMPAGQPRSTNPGASPYGTAPQTPPPTWQVPAYGAGPQKRKKSRAWIWILLSFLVVGLFAVVGFAGFLVYLGVKMDEEAKNRNRTISNSNSNRGKWNSNSQTKTETAGDWKKDDFSKWKTGNLPYGKIEYKDEKLIVTSIKKDYFCVIPAFSNFLSNDTISKLTVKNNTGAASDLGYGLVVHSNPTKALMKDYAFVIRTDGNPSYRIVQHTDSNEKDLVKWTESSAINDGTDENELEVRDEGKKLSFYINDQFITSIDDNLGDDKSIAGIYAGSAIPIAFWDFEVKSK